MTLWRNIRNGFLIIFLALIALSPFVYIDSVSAAQFRSPSKRIIIGKTESPKDLYLVASEVLVEANVAGDLAVIGEKVTVIGDVEGSLFILANEAIVSGSVGKHFRIAGGRIELSGNVNGDVMILSGEAEIKNLVKISGDLIAGVGKLNSTAIVDGDLRIYTDNATIRGQYQNIYGTVNRLNINADTLVNGNIFYQSNNEPNIDERATIVGKIESTRIGSGSIWRRYDQLIKPLYLMQTLITILLLWLILNLWPKTSHNVISDALKQPWQSLGLGLLSLIALMLATVISITSIIGIPLGLLLGAFLILLIFAGGLFGKLILGAWILSQFKVKYDSAKPWLVAAVGVIISVILYRLPFVGPIIGSIIFLIGFGCLIWQVIQWRRLEQQNQ